MGIRYKVFSAIDALGKGPDLLKTLTGWKPFFPGIPPFPSSSFPGGVGPWGSLRHFAEKNLVFMVWRSAFH